MGCLHVYKPKWSSIKRDRFCVKTTLFAEQDAKMRHKNTHGMADKHPRIHGKALHRPGSVPLPHPGLKRLCKPFLTKEKPVLMKNEAVLTCFVPVPGRSLLLSYN